MVDQAVRSSWDESGSGYRWNPKVSTRSGSGHTYNTFAEKLPYSLAGFCLAQGALEVTPIPPVPEKEDRGCWENRKACARRSGRPRAFRAFGKCAKRLYREGCERRACERRSFAGSGCRKRRIRGVDACVSVCDIRACDRPWGSLQQAAAARLWRWGKGCGVVDHQETSRSDRKARRGRVGKLAREGRW